MQNLKKMILLVILVGIFVAFIPSVSAGLAGGLNYIQENRSYYFDTTAPAISISAPTGTLTSRTVDLTATVTDRLNTTCYYRVTDSNLNSHIGVTAFDCSSAQFSVSIDGSFIAFVNATDGINVNESNSSFSVDTTGEGSGGGGGTGGGGSSTTTIIEGNVSAVIDYGTKVSSILVISPPSETMKNLLIKNRGNEDLVDGRIEVSNSLQPYLATQFCDINRDNCGATVNLKSGESGFLTIRGTFPEDFGNRVEGVIRIISKQTYELPIILDRLPLYQILDPVLTFVGSIFSGELFVGLYSTIFGGDQEPLFIFDEQGKLNAVKTVSQIKSKTVDRLSWTKTALIIGGVLSLLYLIGMGILPWWIVIVAALVYWLITKLF